MKPPITIDDARLRQLAMLTSVLGLNADSADEIRALAAEVLMHRGEQFARAELVVALDAAIVLAGVAERNQDEEWEARRKRLTETCDRHERACTPEALEAARSAS